MLVAASHKLGMVALTNYVLNHKLQQTLEASKPP